MLKKITLLALAFIVGMAVNAQDVAFSEDFTGATGSDGTGSLTDLGWAVYDEDGNTINPQLGYLDEAWKIVNFGDVGEVMVSSSWFTTPAQADEWAVTPQISLPETNPYLFY